MTAYPDRASISNSTGPGANFWRYGQRMRSGKGWGWSPQQKQKEEMMETERAELVEIEAAVSACNDVAVSDHIRIALVRDLKPIAENLAEYALDRKSVV